MLLFRLWKGSVWLLALFLILPGCKWIGMRGLAAQDTGEEKVPTPYGCLGAEYCKEEGYNKEACEAYRTCLEENIKATVEGQGVPVDTPPPSIAGTEAADEPCDQVKECPVRKPGTECTGRHHFVPRDPPAYKYEVEDDGSCIRTESYDCSCCHTTYEHAGKPEKVTFGQMQADHRAALARERALTGEAAEIAGNLARHIAGVMQTAEIVASRAQRPQVCAP